MRAAGHALTLAVVLTATVTATASAQPRRGGAPDESPRSLNPQQVHQLFDAMLANQSRQALALTAQQEPQFLERLRTLQRTRRRNQAERVRLIAELQRLTSPRRSETADDAAIDERLRALQEHESRHAAELRRAYDALDEVLTSRQRARFRVLEEQIERRKLDLLGRARQGRRPPGHQ
jgi:Spy/CpxP family protein refolding chaperone